MRWAVLLAGLGAACGIKSLPHPPGSVTPAARSPVFDAGCFDCPAGQP